MKKDDIEKELMKKHFRVAIFGSARIKKEDKTYKSIYQLAKRLGKDGIDIVTGGGAGLMGAANAGHKNGNNNAKVHSLGLLIRLPIKQKANKHLDIKKEFSVFSKRIETFIHLSDAVIVAPGGIGTTLELIYTWQLMQVKEMCNVPIILFGDMWPDLIGWMKKWQLKNNFVNKKDFNLVFSAKNIDEIMKIIEETKKNFAKI